MGIRFFGKKTVCCPCFGGAPSYRCLCHCHRIEDAEFWEMVAYTWICDAETDAEREEAWHRFSEAYPEYMTGESCHDFWHRIHKTRWHHKHGHECHHRHHHHGY